MELNMQITSSLEDYLNAIYELSNKTELVRVTDISIFLNVKKSSTNKALNILKEQNLINYEKYKNVTLTQNGLARAKFVNKRYALFQKFLQDILGVDEKLAKDETKMLSHCISCHTAAKLELFIEKYIEKEVNENNK